MPGPDQELERELHIITRALTGGPELTLNPANVKSRRLVELNPERTDLWLLMRYRTLSQHPSPLPLNQVLITANAKSACKHACSDPLGLTDSAQPL